MAIGIYLCTKSIGENGLEFSLEIRVERDNLVISDSTSFNMEECTMELRASPGDRIRIVFYPIEDDLWSFPKTSCFKIRDVFLLEIFFSNLLLLSLES